MKYDFEFADASPYGAIRDLLVGEAHNGGLVVDLGCGAAAMAQPLSQHGYEYVGCDIDDAYVTRLAERGFEAHSIDLSSPSLAEQITAVLAGRNCAAIIALDVIEHLTDPDGAMRAVAKVAESEGALVGVSIPNVAHFDLAAKLLAGRWDVLPTGLLDRTHVSLFTELRLGLMMSSCGLIEVARNDFVMPDSDQAYPAEHPFLARGTPLGEALRELRRRSDACGEVNQFVRVYRPGPSAAVEPDDRTSFCPIAVAVLVDEAGPALTDLAACLDAQIDPGFEVTWWVPESLGPAFHAAFPTGAPGSTRFVGDTEPVIGHVDREVNYLVVVPERTTLMCHWSESAKTAIREHPGRVVIHRSGTQSVERIAAADVGASGVAVGAEPSWAGVFWPVAAVGADRILMAAATDLAPDELVREAIGLCGEVFVDEITNVSRVPFDGAVAVPQAKLNLAAAAPHTGVHRILEFGESDDLRRDLEHAHEQYRAMAARVDALERSRWWRLTALPRRSVAFVRQFRRGAEADQAQN